MRHFNIENQQFSGEGTTPYPLGASTRPPPN